MDARPFTGHLKPPFVAQAFVRRAQALLQRTKSAHRPSPPRLRFARPMGLTAERLQQWAAQGGLSPREQQQRISAAQKIRAASRGQADGRLLIMSLDLRGFDALTYLPDGLCVGWNLNLSGCTKLGRLPDDLRVGGSLDCSRCPALIYVGPGLAVGGDALFDDCRRLVVLPDDMSVGNNLYLNHCGELTKMPDGLTVGGTLQAMRCRHLAALGHGMWIGRGLDLRFCDRLTELARDVRHVRGDLLLEGCTALQKWSDGLLVAGDLSIVDCVSLHTLGPRLRVAGSVNARGCVQLAHFGPNLKIGRDLDLRGCAAMTQIPLDVSQLFSFDVAPTHDLYVAQTGLTASCVETLRGTYAPAVRILSRAQDSMRAKAYHAIEHLIASWRSYAKSPSIFHGNVSLASWGLASHELRTLRAFLVRLKETADFENRYGRSLLADRLLRMLEAMHGDESLRTACLDQMQHALSSCGDRLSWELGQIEQTVQVHQASRAPQSDAALVALAKQYMRLGVVHRFAQNIIQSYPTADAIEVFLRYEIGVGALVELPVRHRTMFYGHFGMASANDILHVANLAEEHVRSAAAVTAFLDQWAPWQLHLRRVEASAIRFQALPVEHVVCAPNEARCCILTQETWDALQEPVQIMLDGVPGLIYEMQMLLTWWSMHGTDPLLRKPVRLTQLRRVAWTSSVAACSAASAPYSRPAALPWAKGLSAAAKV